MAAAIVSTACRRINFAMGLAMKNISCICGCPLSTIFVGHRVELCGALYFNIASTRPWLYEEKSQKLILTAHSRASWMYAAASVEKMSAWMEPDIVMGYRCAFAAVESLSACEETQTHDGQGNHKRNQEAEHLNLHWTGQPRPTKHSIMRFDKAS